MTPADRPSLVQLNGPHLLIKAFRNIRQYRNHGYLLARANVPEQDVHNGALEIAMLAGRIGLVNVRNSSSLETGIVNAHIQRLNDSKATDAANLHIDAEPDNYCNRYTGQARASTQVVIENPCDKSDQRPASGIKVSGIAFASLQAPPRESDNEISQREIL